MDAPACTSATSPLARFEALVMADEGLQRALARHDSPDSFAAAALEVAAAHGIPLEAGELAPHLRPDPLRIARLHALPPLRNGWPGSDWLPTGIAPLPGGGLAVDWAHFGGARLTEPFFSISARRAEARPFNRLFRHRTTLDDFVRSAPANDAAPPDGLILHLSRCGSTLVAQMLAALPGSVTISEAPPFDALVQLALASPAGTGEHVAALRAMAAAFGRSRSGGGPFFLKLDSWHALALPLLRAAFPTVPWVFLYRDPVEILISQARAPGTQMMPELHDPGFYGIEAGPHASAADYHARVLKRVAESAVGHLSSGGGMPVDYAELPDAVAARILPHFGISPDEEAIAAMAAAARRDAKAPHEIFAPDGEGKRREATDEIRAAAARHLAGVHARLEALRWREARSCI